MRSKRRRSRFELDGKRLLATIAVLAFAVIAIVWITNRWSDRVSDRTTDAAMQSATQTPAPEPTPEPIASVAPDPSPSATPMPIPEGSMLPVVSTRKNTAGKYLALTIDDCFQTDNLREILDLADEYGIKLTFFPIGQVAKKSPELWREIYERGHEIENHSYTHTNMTKLSREEAKQEITYQNGVINRALGLEYEMHFFRPMGGKGVREPWLHDLLRELGYRAVASWGLSGTRNSKETLEMLAPGQVILFHTTDKDLIRLKNVIPGAIEMGYTFVTLNELYDQEPNATSPLEEDIVLPEGEVNMEDVPDDSSD